jgi:hypothetical protein
LSAQGLALNLAKPQAGLAPPGPESALASAAKGFSISAFAAAFHLQHHRTVQTRILSSRLVSRFLLATLRV